VTLSGGGQGFWAGFIKRAEDINYVTPHGPTMVYSDAGRKEREGFIEAAQKEIDKMSRPEHRPHGPPV